ncbi:MAG TPA: hypothetical protein VI790_04000 [Candidatus Nanoarchaeia archaeon]|nr:hypothetical protein [Candidatus Nanoarchaeia archaeon]
MKELLIDSSSLISMATNCLMWVIDKLRESSEIQFVITPEIHKEVIEKSMNIDKFRLSGIRILKRLCNGAIIVKETDMGITNRLLDIANKIYSVKGDYYHVVHEGELGLIPLAIQNKSYTLATDERIFFKMITDPEGLKRLFENRLHTAVTINQDKLNEFKELTKDIDVFKSSDLVAIAYEKGLMNEYIKECESKKLGRDLLTGSLWALKMSGCSISTLDIKEYESRIIKNTRYIHKRIQ